MAEEYNIDPYVAAGTQLLSSAIGAYQSGRNVKATNTANRELAEYAYGQDLAMWNLQNEYNSPKSQVARLKAAGLNPVFMYGSGSASAGNASTLPKYNAPRMDFMGRKPVVDFAPMLQMYQNMRMNKAQTDNITKEIELKDQKILSEAIGRAHKAAGIAGVQARSELNVELAKYAKELALQQAENINRRNKLLYQQEVESQSRQMLQDKEGKKKDIELGWYRKGMRPTDQIQWRMMIKIAEMLGINIPF